MILSKSYFTSLNSLAEGFFKIAAANPERLFLKYPEEISSGIWKWQRRSFGESARRVASIANYLAERGVKRGDKVAIISGTRPEWLEMDLAILSLGACVVAIYPSLTWQDIGFLLYDSETSLVVVENHCQLEKIIEITKNPIPIPQIEKNTAFETRLTVRETITFEKCNSSIENLNIKTFEEILNLYPKPNPPQFKENHVDLLASLVYTSGTTGAPKGVPQTEKNHLANLRQAFEANLFEANDTIFLALPLAHSFARLMGYIGAVAGCSLAFSRIVDRQRTVFDPTALAKDMADSAASIFPLVPRILEKIHLKINHLASHKGLRGWLTKQTLRGAFWSGPLKNKIKKTLFGKNFKYIISGSAKLPLETALFFEKLGIEILEGYGLTETCVATHVNRIGKKKIGTVGPPLANDIECRTATDGEILIRGPNVVSGYFKRHQATAESFDKDGWFHTGDLGSIDQEGFLTITGRKKELIVTSGGKKIVPDKLEQLLKGVAGISHAFICGEGRNYIVALAIIDQSYFEISETLSRASTASKPTKQRSEIIEEIKIAFANQVAQANKQLASFETIKKFALIDSELSIENNLLTPTLKPRRHLIEQRFKEEIDRLYN